MTGEAILSLLQNGGPFGFVALALWYIFRLQTRIDDLQDKRVDDQNRIADCINDNTNALTVLAERIKAGGDT